MITIKSSMFHAVQACIDPKDDRGAIQGFYIDPVNKVVVGTNGHILLAAPYEGEHLGGIYELVKLPRRKVPYDVRFDENMAYGLGNTAAVLTPIDATYPDWKRVVKVESTKAADRMTFDPELLAPVAAALGSACRLEDDGTQRYRVTWLGYPQIQCILMGVSDKQK